MDKVEVGPVDGSSDFRLELNVTAAVARALEARRPRVAFRLTLAEPPAVRDAITSLMTAGDLSAHQCTWMVSLQVGTEAPRLR